MGKMSLQISKANIQNIIRESIRPFKIARNVRIKTFMPKKSLILKVDESRIKQVIYNILDNAKRYTPPKGKIEIKAEDIGDGIMISIKDEGHGITEEELGKVFEKFYRCKNDPNNEKTGSGLGLSIARGIIEVHRGKIWVESEQGKGSRFIFTLPKG